jgi:hypothetical protein
MYPWKEDTDDLPGEVDCWSKGFVATLVRNVREEKGSQILTKVAQCGRRMEIWEELGSSAIARLYVIPKRFFSSGIASAR